MLFSLRRQTLSDRGESLDREVRGSSALSEGFLPSNETQIRRGMDAVLETRKRRVGVVGLSFKPGTDDLRESPMVTLVEALIGKGCDVRILDPSVSLAQLVGAIWDRDQASRGRSQ